LIEANVRNAIRAERQIADAMRMNAGRLRSTQ
jgi:hypothetical protein